MQNVTYFNDQLAADLRKVIGNQSINRAYRLSFLTAELEIRRHSLKSPRPRQEHLVFFSLLCNPTTSPFSYVAFSVNMVVSFN